MPRTRDRTHTLTIFKVRPGIVDPDEVILDRAALEDIDVRIGRKHIGILYVKEPEPRPPQWLSYFAGAADLNSNRLKGAAPSAVLLLKRPTGIFALTFGYGRWLLNEESLEPTFGLRTTLNAIEPTKIRSMDHRRLDAIARHTREQVSRASGLMSFGLDVQRDLLRAVTGTPIDSSYGKQLSGAMGLAATGPFPLSRLQQALDRFDALHSGDGYRANFPWVDNIAEVTDRLLITQLDEELVTHLRRESLDRIWLAVPDMIHWGTITGFQFRRGDEHAKHVDVELVDYFAEVRPPASLTKEHLRSDKIFVEDVQDAPMGPSWTVYKCIVAEITVSGTTYFLSEGKWYRVAQEFRQLVEATVATTQPTTLTLPLYGDRTEEDYNRRAAEGSNGTLHLLDRDLIKCGTGARIESCDLFSSDKKLVHVKHYGASSVLSHLFVQGVSSAQMLAQDLQFRRAFNDKLPNTHRLPNPDESPRAGEFEVAYAIIKPTTRNTIPFLSQITLHNSATLLRQLGFRTTLTYIRAHAPTGR